MKRVSTLFLVVIAVTALTKPIVAMADDTVPEVDALALGKLEARDRQVIDPLLTKVLNDKLPTEDRIAAAHLANLLIKAAEDTSKPLPASEFRSLSDADKPLLQMAAAAAVDPESSTEIRERASHIAEALVRAGIDQIVATPAGGKRPEFTPRVRKLIKWSIKTAVDPKLTSLDRKNAERVASSLTTMKAGSKPPQAPDQKDLKKPNAIYVAYKDNGVIKYNACTASTVGHQNLGAGQCRYQMELPTRCLAAPGGPSGWHNPSALSFSEFGVIKDFDVHYPGDFVMDATRNKNVSLVSFKTECISEEEVNLFKIAPKKPELKPGKIVAMPELDRKASEYLNLRFSGYIGRGDLKLSGKNAVASVINGDPKIKGWVNEDPSNQAQINERTQQVANIVGRTVHDGSPIISDPKTREVVAFNYQTNLLGDTMCTSWECTSWVRNKVKYITENHPLGVGINRADRSAYKLVPLTEDEEGEIEYATALKRMQLITQLDPLGMKN